jgi:hypothetical protein
MAKLITKDLAVCGDCLAYIANGTTEDAAIDAICAKGRIDTLAYYEVTQGTLVAAGAEDEEGFFSWRECDCCKRPQGGNRYMAGILA